MRTLLVVGIVVFVALLAVGGWVYAGHHASAPAAAGAGPSPTAVAVTSPAAAASPATASAAADGAGTKPCSLVTRDEMQAILGAPIQRLTTAEAECAYLTDDTHQATVETTWRGGRTAMEDAKKYNGETMRAVPGLGDEAYFQAAGVMHVRKGDVYLIVNSRVYPNEEVAETAIVRKALARLK